MPFICFYCLYIVCLCKCGCIYLFYFIYLFINQSISKNTNNACKCNNGRPAWWALAFLAACHLCNSIFLHCIYCLFVEMQIKYDDDDDDEWMNSSTQGSTDFQRPVWNRRILQCALWSRFIMGGDVRCGKSIVVTLGLISIATAIFFISNYSRTSSPGAGVGLTSHTLQKPNGSLERQAASTSDWYNVSTHKQSL